MAAVGCKKPPPPKEEPPPPLRPSVSLTAELSSIERGKSATLNWSSQNANSASFNQGVGAVPKSGSREVFPAQSTSYQITAKGADGEAAASVSNGASVPASGAAGAEYYRCLPREQYPGRPLRL